MLLDKLLSNISYANVAAIEKLEHKFDEDPQSIRKEWHRFFSELNSSTEGKRGGSLLAEVAPPSEREDLRVSNLIGAYRTYGHLFASFNPLESAAKEEPWQLRLETWGLNEASLEESFPTEGIIEKTTAPLKEIVEGLQKIYCNKIGIEYMGMQSLELERWLQQQIEPAAGHIDLEIEKKKMILEYLNRSEIFESFLHTKYTGQKRFSLEGAETIIPMLIAALEKGAQLGVTEFIFGMAHRGRLNVLSNILNKSYKNIFSEFEEWYVPTSAEESGDVKYHKGFSSLVTTPSGYPVKVVLAPNPSHLESVDPVVEGMVRAKQDSVENGVDKIIPLLVHGDAALSGQGVIYETLQLYRLPGYATGGTVHIVINNQIGFTTLPEESRSTRYCTDIARAFGAPVFHVNAEDPEGCFYAVQLAILMRQQFHCDVFIDLYCHRKYGHNESDEPFYTQPLLYQIIRKKRPIRELYRDSIIHQTVLERDIAESLENNFKLELQKSLEEKIASEPDKLENIKLELKEKNVEKRQNSEEISTEISYDTLLSLTTKICSVPENFTLHSKLINLLKERLQMAQKEKGKLIDWGLAELIAYASLLVEGTPIRLSGQDSCRGTFSHRHAVWIDQKEGAAYSPLAHLSREQAPFAVFNSPLSEYAVLAFEYGFSVGSPASLVLWEAQFGDFCNGAQITIDQYIASGEKKWGQKSGIVLLLPHGYEGQGPEHSSARMERFLALAAEENMKIVNPTSPAQFFHLIRLQAKQSHKQPLIIFTPKGLLRHPRCVSSIEEFTTGSFHKVLDDSDSGAKESKTVVFCTGRIFFDLAAKREVKASKIALIRIEQLYPFPAEQISALLKKYKKSEQFFWAQDEPINMGAWEYIRTDLQSLLPKNRSIEYIGRARSASPACGLHARHNQEHEAIMQAIFPD